MRSKADETIVFIFSNFWLMKSHVSSRNFKVSSRSRSYDVSSRLGRFGPRFNSGF